MINFRYHVVSIGAILLALAAGIVLGSGPLDDAGEAIRGDDTSEAVDPAVESFESAYAGRTAGSLLDGALDGESVVVLTVPGSTTAEVEGVTDRLTQAGAQVTGEVALTARLLDSSGRQFAEGVAQQAGADVPGVDAAGDSYGRIGAALGRTLLADETSEVDGTADTIRSAFVEGDLIGMTTEPESLATVAVLVAAPQRSGGAGQNEVIAALAAGLQDSGSGIVVAGPASSSTDGGAVQAVRDAESGNISTVDVTDTASGRVVVALATARQVADQAGSWGTSRSADGALPD